MSETTWRDGGEAPIDVAHLSVFDSHNARFYVDERNRIDYLPIRSRVTYAFWPTLDEPSRNPFTRIKVVDERLTVGLPTGYTPGTAVCEIVNRLTPKTPVAELPTIQEIIALGTRTDELAQGLEALQQTIGNDPKVLAYRCRRVQGVVSSFIEELTKARDTLSQAKAPELEQAVSHARATAEAASLAATTLFKDEPLPHVGSDPWQLMYQHAKDYSKLAYPGSNRPRHARVIYAFCVSSHWQKRPQRVFAALITLLPVRREKMMRRLRQCGMNNPRLSRRSRYAQQMMPGRCLASMPA